MHAPYPIQSQCVGGNLHNCVGAAGICHPGKQCLQIGAFRCGTLCGNHLVTDQVLHGADQAHLCPPDCFQNMLQQQRYRSLAVSAGNTDHTQFLCRMVIEIGSNLRHSRAICTDHHIRHILLRLFGRHHHCCPLFHSAVNKPVAVGGKAGNCHKQVAGLHFPGVKSHTGNFHIHICVDFYHIHTLKKLTEFHNPFYPFVSILNRCVRKGQGYDGACRHLGILGMGLHRNHHTW